MKETETTTQTKPPISRGAVHILAYSIGAREAARRLGIKESTLLSWSHLNGSCHDAKLADLPLRLRKIPATSYWITNGVEG